MKVATLKFRKPREEASETEAAAEETQASALSWTGGSAAATKVISYLLISSLVAGPLSLLAIGWLILTATGPAPAPVTSGDTATVVDERSAVQGFAEDFVVTWLTSPDGEEDRLAVFMDDYSGVTLPTVPWSVSNPTAAGIEETEDGTWSVTVAATVGGKKQPGLRRYFRVPVTYLDGALAAAALPTPVSGPQLAVEARLDYRYRATNSDAVSVAAGEFLNALLVGSGDVTRFISPGASIRAVSPAPYTVVELEDVLVDQELTEGDATPETGRTLHLLVTAIATATADQQITVSYALTMTAREGRWEVAAIDASPRTLPAPQGSPSPDIDGTDEGTDPDPSSPTATSTSTSTTN